MSRITVIGEVLFDVFPENKCLGGAPFNFAFHLHGLGIEVNFISRIGDDAAGHKVLKFARQFGFPVEGIQIDPDHETGEVRVTVDNKGMPEFHIMPDRAYDFIATNSFTDSLAIPENKLVYIGTLVQRSGVSRESIRKMLGTMSPHSMVMTDLNLRAPFYDRGVIEFNLHSCDILKVNQEELNVLQIRLSFRGNPKNLVKFLQETYDIGTVCITKGEKGSELYAAGRFEPFVAPVAKVNSMKDTVGAGDAFSAMLAVGLLKGWPGQVILDKASEFSARICEFSGALPSSAEFYQPYKVQ